jgi:hypothetical protein
MPDTLTPEKELKHLDEIERCLKFQYRRLLAFEEFPPDPVVTISLADCRGVGLDPRGRAVLDLAWGFRGVDADGAEIRIHREETEPDGVEVTDLLIDSGRALRLEEIFRKDLHRAIAQVPRLGWKAKPEYHNSTIFGTGLPIDTSDARGEIIKALKEIKEARAEVELESDQGGLLHTCDGTAREYSSSEVEVTVYSNRVVAQVTGSRQEVKAEKFSKGLWGYLMKAAKEKKITLDTPKAATNRLERSITGWREMTEEQQKDLARKQQDPRRTYDNAKRQVGRLNGKLKKYLRLTDAPFATNGEGVYYSRFRSIKWVSK